MCGMDTSGSDNVFIIHNLGLNEDQLIPISVVYYWFVQALKA